MTGVEVVVSGSSSSPKEADSVAGPGGLATSVVVFEVPPDLGVVLGADFGGGVWWDSWPPSETRRLIVEFQWFLIALSVRPGSRFAISAHLFPSSS